MDNIKDKFTICLPSLDRGFIKSRLYTVLEELAGDKNLFDCNILVLAQQYSEESIALVEGIKDKLPNLKIVYRDGLVKSFPMIRTAPASFAETEFVYVIDDDRHFRGDTSEFLDKIGQGIDLLNSTHTIMTVHYRSYKTPGVNLCFPHRVTEVKNLFRTTDIKSNVLDEWINVRNLEDITMSPCILDKGYLTAIISLDKFKHRVQNPEAGDSFTSNTAAFGVPLRQRMNEYYIVMADFQEKAKKFKDIVTYMVETESEVISEFNINVDINGTNRVHEGAWTPKTYWPSMYEKYKEHPMWKSVLLDIFHKSLGLDGVPNTPVIYEV